MSTRFILFVIVMAVVVLVSPAYGATEQGMVELNGAAAFAKPIGERAADESVYAISTQVTYFTTDMFSVGARLAFAGASSEDWSGTISQSTLGLHVVADVHLTPASTVVPFFGGAIGFERYSVKWESDDWWRDSCRATSEYDDTDVVVEFHGGAKAFLRDNIAVTMEARYTTTPEFFGDFGVFSLLAGISVFLF